MFLKLPFAISFSVFICMIYTYIYIYNFEVDVMLYTISCVT